MHERLYLYLDELEISRLYLGLELAYFISLFKTLKFINLQNSNSQVVNQDVCFNLKVKWSRYLTVAVATNTLRPMFINCIVFKTSQYIAA